MRKLNLFFLIIIVAASGILLAAADFGESSTSLGQFVDEFTDLNNVSVQVEVVRNATLNAMELNKSSEYDDVVFSDVRFSEYFEGFPAGWTVVTANGGTITKDNAQVYNGNFSVKVNTPANNRQAYAYRSMPEEANDYDLEYYIYPSSSYQANFVYIMFTTDVGTGTHFLMQLDFDAGDYNLINGGADVVGILNADEWNRINVHWDDTANKLNYSINLELKGLFNALGDTNPDRIYIGDTSAVQQSGVYWLDDIRIGDASRETFLGYASEGYFTTTDYLDQVNGSTLVLMTEADIPVTGGITVEFSNDNATWGNSRTLTDGRLSIDLRFLNESGSFYLNYSLTTSDISETPRLNQSRLITTEGEVGPGIPGFNVTGEWIEYQASAINFTVGAHAGGDLNSTFDIDGDTWNHTEVVGAPGSVISINFTGVDPDAECIWVTLWYLYDGNLQHDYDIEMWNFTSSAWVDDGHIVDGVAFSWVNSTIYAMRIPLDFLSGGEVRVQLNHESPGNVNHNLFIDYVRLVAKVPGDVGAGAVTVTVVESDFPWIAIAIILMMVAYLLFRPK